MTHSRPPRKVTYFEPVPPRLARNTIIESTFDVGRRQPTKVVSLRGTDGSNPSPPRGESTAN